jgi:hypothetical protein
MENGWKTLQKYNNDKVFKKFDYFFNNFLASEKRLLLIHRQQSNVRNRVLL